MLLLSYMFEWNKFWSAFACFAKDCYGVLFRLRLRVFFALRCAHIASYSECAFFTVEIRKLQLRITSAAMTIGSRNFLTPYSPRRPLPHDTLWVLTLHRLWCYGGQNFKLWSRISRKRFRILPNLFRQQLAPRGSTKPTHQSRGQGPPLGVMCPKRKITFWYPEIFRVPWNSLTYPVFESTWAWRYSEF